MIVWAKRDWIMSRLNSVGGVDDEPVIHDLDRRAVVKPGVQRRGGQILPENGKNAVPYVVEGIHSFLSPYDP